ncbi:hypothetical protein PybrP1_008049 [[Pythium] brassicae (nom. inval.)]|nr:hypothetical protein PybrP1_008049 [[Pythium] brassicae (nom. inval.)]
MDSAARNGNLVVVQLLCKHFSEGCTTRAVDDKVAHGNRDYVALDALVLPQPLVNAQRDPASLADVGSGPPFDEVLRLVAADAVPDLASRDFSEEVASGGLVRRRGRPRQRPDWQRHSELLTVVRRLWRRPHALTILLLAHRPVPCERLQYAVVHLVRHHRAAVYHLLLSRVKIPDLILGERDNVDVSSRPDVQRPR